LHETVVAVLGLATIRRIEDFTWKIAEATRSHSELKSHRGGDFPKLPGGIYTTSYIRQYAKAIDLTKPSFLAFYRAQMGIPRSAGRNERAQRWEGLMGGGYRPASSIG